MLSRAMTRRTRTRSDTDERVGRQPKALLEPDLGLVAEQPPRRAHVRPGVAHVAGALWEELLLERPLEDPPEHLGQVVHGLGTAARDVEDLAVHAVGLRGEEVRGDDVADVREVARLLAVAVDRHRLAGR